MKIPSLRPGLLVVVASLAPISTISAPPSATAEVFFRPFGFTFNQPIPEPAPDVSPRRISAILAHRGFRLVGPLGYRGDQIVAAGVDAHGVRRRFLVDPYEGEILSSWRIGPPGAPPAPYGAVVPAEPYGAPEAIPPAESGDPLVIPGVGGETRHSAPPRAATPPRAKMAAHPPGEAASRAARRPAQPQAGKAAPATAVSPSETQTPAPIAVAPAQATTTTAPPAPAPATAATPTVAPSGAETAGVPPAPASPTPPVADEQPKEPAPEAASGTEPHSARPPEAQGADRKEPEAASGTGPQPASGG